MSTFEGAIYVADSNFNLTWCLILDIDISSGCFLIFEDDKAHSFSFLGSKIINLNDSSLTKDVNNNIVTIKGAKFVNMNSLIIYNNNFGIIKISI